MMNKKLKIGIDFHGVIDSNYGFFREFTREALACGFDVFVITGGGEAEVASLLKKNEISYSYLYSMKDFFQKQGLLKVLEDGRFSVSEDVWNFQKAQFCLENEIDIHLDDSVEYLKAFKTTSCLYDKTKTGCTFSNHIKIDFSENPKQVLAEIEKYVFSGQDA